MCATSRLYGRCSIRKCAGQNPAGDYLTGHDEVLKHWRRLWQEIDVHDEPTEIRELTDARLDVAVHQVIKDKQGTILSEGPLKVLYAFQEGLIQQMDFEQVQ